MIVPLQVTNYYLLSILNNIIDPALAAPTLLAAAKSGLGITPIAPNLNTVIADVGEASYTGYAESATIVWTTPVNDVDSTPTSNSPSHLFRVTTTGATQNINNCFVTDGVASPNQGILASGTITPPIALTNLGDGFTMQVSWNLYYGNSENIATIIQ